MSPGTWRINAILLIVTAVAAGPVLALEQIGSVERVENMAFGTPPDSARRRLADAIAVYRNEMIETESNGVVSLRFIDGTQLALGSRSRLTLDEMVFVESEDDTFAIQLGEGLFHFVTGAIDSSRVVIDTPVSTIGIRGTDIAIEVLADGTTSLAVLSGLATLASKSGGLPEEVRAGQTGLARSGGAGVQVSNGLAGFAGAGLPAVGSTSVQSGSTSPDGGVEADRSTPTRASSAAEPADTDTDTDAGPGSGGAGSPASGPGSGSGGSASDGDGAGDPGGGEGGGSGAERD